MKKIKNAVAAMALLLFVVGCKKSGTDSSAAIQFQVQSTNRSATINAPVLVNSIVWSSGFAIADLIKLEGKNNGSGVEFKSKSSQRVDLFSSVAAALGNITLPAGKYDEVEFKIELNSNGTDPALQLNGEFTNAQGIVKPVVFTVKSVLEIKAEQNNITVTDNSSTTALTTLDLSLLTNGVSQASLNNATLTNGTIVISESSNAAIYNTILLNLQQSHEVEVDHH